MHSDNTLLANGRALAADWGHTADSVVLSLSPMSLHIGTVALEQVLVTGATYMMGVPTHAMDILQEVRERGLTALGAVRTFYMAGAPIPREVAQKFVFRATDATLPSPALGADNPLLDH